MIKGGQLIGKSGNTGMRESTLGSRAGSHLHWEMILQRGENEIYLGKNMPNPELYQMLTNIFE
jgi:murein DD-endopeptidase MepM/ murein hydrolase activator NlpD